MLRRKCSEITLNALRCFQHIVPCAHKEYIVAAGIDDAYMQAVQNAVDVALENSDICRENAEVRDRVT